MDVFLKKAGDQRSLKINSLRDSWRKIEFSREG
jgi:hypothetical protein